VAAPNADGVIETIRAAFSGVKRDEGISLREANVIDNYGTDEERAIARAGDTDTAWHEVPDTLLERACSALAFMDQKGLRYYLPAFMVWTLRNYATSNSFTVDSTIYALDVSHGRTMPVLSEAQLQACAAFLAFMADDGVEMHADANFARRLIEQGWSRHLPAIE
jgi:hypothetical protein